MSDTITITRKYTLIPTFSERKEWIKRIMDFTKDSYTQKIEYYEDKLKKTKKKEKEERNKIENRLNSLKNQQKDFIENGILLQSNVNDYTYELIREAMKSEACRKNAIISYVFMELLARNAVDMDFKERNKLIFELTKYGYRIKGSKSGSLFDLFDIDNPLGGYGIAFSQQLTAKIRDMVNKDRVLEGRKSATLTYKLDSPFTIAKTAMSFSHDYDSFEELCEHIKEKDCNLYFNFGGNGNPTIARFKINLGANRKNKDELIATILRVYSGEYQFCGSSIGIEKQKIILNLSMKIPKQKKKLDENTVVGIYLGMAAPATCAINNKPNEKLTIGDTDDFLRNRTKFQAQRVRLQKSLKYTSGGHGRKKKLKALERLKKSESHFAETTCHVISKNAVDFALKNHAKYINIESGKIADDSILKNLSHYRIQQYITYKAAKYGIEVREVNVCGDAESCKHNTDTDFSAAEAVAQFVFK